MKVKLSGEQKRFKTPFHAYNHYNVRDFCEILKDIETGDLPTNTGKPFDVNFPIDTGLEEPNLTALGSIFK